MNRIVLLLFISFAIGVNFSQAQNTNADPRRPAAIETQEVPVVPPEVYQRLQQYQDIRYAGFSGWDPAGNGILIRTRFGATSQLHQVRTPAGKRQQITFFDEPVKGYPIPKAKDGSLMVSLSRGGNEKYQVYLVDRKNYTTTLMTDGKTRNRLQVFSEDGRRMIVASNKRNGRDTDLYVADARQPNSMQLVFQTEKEYWYAADWSRDGKTLLLGRYVSINESYAALLDLKTKQRRDIPLFGNRQASINDMQFAADGKSVYLATDANGEFRQLARVDIDSGKYHWLTADIPWDVSDVEVHAQRSRGGAR
jgi:dipeptidyl aminopeptidase/acylaminoacyl peptidase